MPSDEQLYLRNQLCFPLYAASRLTTKLYGPLLQKLDLSYPQYLVLLLLWEEDARRLLDISQLLYLESNTLSPLLKRMEAKGLLHRQRSQNDERELLLFLSERGRALKEQAACIPQELVRSLEGSESLGAQELWQLKEKLDALLALLSERG